MPERAVRTPLAALLAERIRACGPITFADYMEACLYHPEHGYYSRPDARRFADYYTSVDVHPIFGRLLARQFCEMWERMGRPALFSLVELGAGVGRLAVHILDFASHSLPELYSALSYVPIEGSAARRRAQEAALVSHAEAGRVSFASEPPALIPAGCIFSNEFFDALPVHRVVRESGEVREIYVSLAGDEFAEQFGPLSTLALSDYFSEQGIELAEGQQAEVNLAACRWIEEAGRRLGRGFVVTVDYGHEALELYNERHLRGTVLSYERHRTSEEFYRAPGEQDLTAHVNFTALDLWGRRAGLQRVGLVSQAHFLLALGRSNDFSDLCGENASEIERLRARLLLKKLIHPEGMGEVFQVFLQQKGVQPFRLTGFAPL
jgi:SAM-dependent MidA family methyltransferase